VITITYTNYTNIDASFCRTYEPGDRLVRGYTGSIEIEDWDGFVSGPHNVAERIFARHNRDDRPDGQLCPSMSVGDVIIISETAVSVDRVGFVVVQLDAADLIIDRTWKDMARS